MNFAIGDRVKFLNDTGGGVITSFIDRTVVNVKTPDGFEMPVLVKELIPDGTQSEKKETPPNHSTPTVSLKKEIKTNVDYQEYKGQSLLAVTPKDAHKIHNSSLMVYFINNANYECYYVITALCNAHYELFAEGKLTKNSKTCLKTLNQSDISKIRKFRVQSLYFKTGKMQNITPSDANIDISQTSFYKVQEYQHNDFFKDPAVIFPLDVQRESVGALSEPTVSDVLEKEVVEKRPESKSPRKMEETIEVDLHMHELIESTKGMSNGEMVNMQISYFRDRLNEAIERGIEKIVFIHGVGNGKLKQDIRAILDREYKKITYQDGSFQKYGFGATMVNLK